MLFCSGPEFHKGPFSQSHPWCQQPLVRSERRPLSRCLPPSGKDLGSLPRQSWQPEVRGFSNLPLPSRLLKSICQAVDLQGGAGCPGLRPPAPLRAPGSYVASCKPRWVDEVGAVVSQAPCVRETLQSALSSWVEESSGDRGGAGLGSRCAGSKVYPCHFPCSLAPGIQVPRL